jgi:hypothetical protein
MIEQDRGDDKNAACRERDGDIKRTRVCVANIITPCPPETI